MYRQLRAAYQLSRLGAAVRAFLLLNFSFVAAGLFFSLLLALGVLG
jgi:type III secretory pathway component EscR